MYTPRSFADDSCGEFFTSRDFQLVRMAQER